MIGFQYLSTNIKSILTKAGEILEIYTYFTVCEKGWFDEGVDIVSTGRKKKLTMN